MESIKGNGTILLFIGILIAFIIFEAFNYQTVNYNLNSDDASELVLARLLSENGGIVSSEWFYSTEIRILNTQLIFAPLFLIFRQWFIVRFIGTTILHIILLLSGFYLCKALRCSRFFLLVGVILIFPFSQGYYDFVLRVPYYVPHISITLISLALVLYYISVRGTRKRLLIIILLIALSFLSGLGGARQVIICYLPLLVCSIILYIYLFNGNCRVKRKECRAIALCSGICFLSSFAGYCINAVLLSKYYSFIAYSPHFIPPDFNRLSNVIVGIFNSLGYRSGDICLQTVTCNVFCAMLLISTLYCMIFGLRKHSGLSLECLFMSCYFCSSIALFALLFVFTDMAYEDRYNLPIIVIIPFLLAVYLNQSISNEKKAIHIHNIRINYVNMIVLLFLLLIIGSSRAVFCNYNRWKIGPIDRMEVVDYLLSNGYSYGYATFWNANVFTELSDGNIRVHDWGDIPDKTAGLNKMNRWLQLVDEDGYIPEGKIFLVYGKSELDEAKLVQNLNDEDIIFSNDWYVIYGFDDYKKAENILFSVF